MFKLSYGFQEGLKDDELLLFVYFPDLKSKRRILIALF